MHIRRLQIQSLRSLDDVRIELESGLNLLIGPNGAGKSSVLEAVYLLSHGRSFRSGAREALIQRGRDGLSIFAEVSDTAERHHRLGLGRQGGRWQAHIDGEAGRNMGELVAHCAAICFEPGSHALIAGPAEERRRYLDWGVFHVEHTFLMHWRRYQRALRQRNATLRVQGRMLDASALEPWEAEMSRAGEAVESARRDYIDRLRPHLDQHLHALVPELGAVRLEYRRGWSEEQALGEALEQRRERDAMRGHTATGPHRADWHVVFEHAPQREHLSRGQEKLCALGCMLAQGSLYAESSGSWPIVCLDDLASELDQAHQRSVAAALASVQAQVLITGTDFVPALDGIDATLFHVEHGDVRRHPPT
ncbi:DNA replication/repair protein RecF [Oleiagrimonas citrea]|uniref:DNA replication and repair protein RecF n=1 Tax=Oleiagrimonas citrea TaxID=1665687 RepID=A0A846ZQ64_9GAMM|nr:DNA replication/repair protein RecF [Oleiagrimonas citrea]NKZ40072.1 DNA replication/repair protein RecF [Oleiagrimonas citrea]